MRRVHTIQHTGNRPFPGAVVFVQSNVKQKYLGDADDVGHLALSEWQSAFSVMEGKELALRGFGKGKNVAGWWKWLREVCHPHLDVWIVSYEAREQMAALDLWGEIADDRATLRGADPRNQGDYDSELSRARDGYVILEGPPTVVCFRGTPERPVYTWVDPANFGAGQPANHGSLEEECGRAYRWLVSYWCTVRQYDLGGAHHTAASQAMDGYRHAYMQHRIVIHDSAKALQLERAALYGGRCEARFIGTINAGERDGTLHKMAADDPATRYGAGPIYHLDVNSLYPSVARDALLPCELRAVCGPTNVDVAMSAARNCAVVADVVIDTPVPCVPMRLARTVVWPTGKFRTTLCGPELLLAREHATSMHVVSMTAYEARPLYNHWVTKLHAERVRAQLDGIPTLADTLKRILNASFGKWAQLSKRWVPVPDALPPMPYTQWYGDHDEQGRPEQWRALAWEVQRLVIQGETNESFPALTAYVNSLGRAALWNLIQVAGPHNVYYYDTDSLFVNSAGMWALDLAGHMDETGLGKLKLLGTYTTLRIMGRQAYEKDGKLVLSGAGDAVVRGGDTFAMTLRAPPIQHYLLQDKSPGLDRHVVKVSTTRNYVHGHVQPDGSVLPLVIAPDAKKP